MCTIFFIDKSKNLKYFPTSSKMLIEGLLNVFSLVKSRRRNVLELSFYGPSYPARFGLSLFSIRFLVDFQVVGLSRH